MSSRCRCKSPVPGRRSPRGAVFWARRKARTRGEWKGRKKCSGPYGTKRLPIADCYLLLDDKSGMGVLVSTPHVQDTATEPALATISGRLFEMDPDLEQKIQEDDWGKEGIVLVDRVLQQIEAKPIPGRLIVVVACLVVAAFLLLTALFDYVFFWPEAEGTEDPPPAHEKNPPDEVALDVTASLPIAGTFRRLQLVERSGQLEKMAGGWKVVAYHEPSDRMVAVPLPTGSIEQVTRGRVYFKGKSKYGLWMLYRETRGRRRHLCLSLGLSAQRRMVYELLRGAGEGATPW